MPLICRACPIPAVMAIPRQPPAMTRAVGVSNLDPAMRALNTPVKVRPMMVNATMLHAACPKDGANAPANGISPPAVKLRADAIAA